MAYLRIIRTAMLSREFKKEESLIRYWANQAIELCYDIDDEELIQETAQIHAAIQRLNRDRRIIFIGDSKCGKSSLLAGVAQYPHIAGVPMKDEYLCWRYRCADGDATCSAFIPMENLEGLELTDTATCADPANQDTILALMNTADVVIAVMDGRFAESSTVWPLLAALPIERKREVLITVTHTDLLGADEALKLKEKLQEISRMQLSAAPSIHFICPTTQKGLDSFIVRIKEALQAKHGLKADLKRVVDLTNALLSKQSNILRIRQTITSNNDNFLKDIDSNMQHFLKMQLDSAPLHADQYASTALMDQSKVIKALKKAMGRWLSPVTLVRMNLFGSDTENYYYHTVCDSIRRLQEESDAQFMASCHQHWDLIRPRMKKAMECDIGTFPAQSIAAELKSLRKRFTVAVHKPFNDTQLGHAINRTFLNSAFWMKFFVAIACLCLTVAGGLGAFGLTFLAIWMVLSSIIVWGLGSLFHLVSVAQCCREFSRHGEALALHMKECILPDIKDHFFSRMAAYRRLYNEPQKKVDRNKRRLAPIREQHLNIARQLATSLPR